MSSLMRYTPTMPAFTSLRREIDRIFDDLLRTEDGEQVQTALWAPRTDISETDDHYVLRMDMPGLSKKDVTIELRDDTLTVSGERKSEHEEKKENFHRVERSYGRFFRSFTLPQASDTQKVKAHMKDGVLTIEVPKREETRPRRIEIS
ncbi:heat-shock protein [Rhodothermaceae bacterium RA]|nr:heat-shock protein [Rhodothermaceae bacterium RA]